MKKAFILLILAFGLNEVCNAQKITGKEMEKYDFELINKSMKNPIGIVRNGWTIIMYKMTSSGAYYNEYPPAPDFYKIVKTFHPNGNLKSIGKIVGANLLTGIWKYYDEYGNLIKEINEDRKFRKIKQNDILKFVEKEECINLKTGEGREFAEISENGNIQSHLCRFYVNLVEDERKYWAIEIPPAPWNNHFGIIYHIDTDSGNILYKKSKQEFPVM